MFGDKRPATGKKGRLEGFALILRQPGQQAKQSNFEDIKQFSANRDAMTEQLGKDDKLEEITLIRTDDGKLEEYSGVWLDDSTQIGDPYVQVFCKNDSALMSEISGRCGYAWWPTFGKPITHFFTCDRCIGDDDDDFDDVAVMARGRDVHSGTTAEDMPFDEEY
jgi:hypothetical protein